MQVQNSGWIFKHNGLVMVSATIYCRLFNLGMKSRRASETSVSEEISCWLVQVPNYTLHIKNMNEIDARWLTAFRRDLRLYPNPSDFYHVSQCVFERWEKRLHRNTVPRHCISFSNKHFGRERKFDLFSTVFLAYNQSRKLKCSLGEVKGRWSRSGVPRLNISAFPPSRLFTQLLSKRFVD